ncbi:uncharacterized protein VTP21DRAFT_3826 [Calcarisporiella thermophila]|uniref:uncharacterized protein n=1 Tax=Calcarisporiella thermophila TaxID=911321 RepID=UPI0037446F0B
MSAEEFKNKGNQAFLAKNYEVAIEHFTKAIELDPTNHVLYSNRSASYASLKQYERALEDAEKTVSLKQDWGKGYSRKGAALHGLNRLAEARLAYREGLKHEPNNPQLKKALEDLENSFNPQDALGRLFSGDILAKIGGNPKLAPYLTEPDYVEKIKAIQANPSVLTMHMQDKRILTTMMGLMGIDANMPTEMPEMPEMPESSSVPSGTSSASHNEKPTAAKEPEPEPEPMETEEKDESAKQKEEALKEKELGNQAYKQKQFEEALLHYEKAWELDNTNISILTNKGAVLFEMGKYEECIKVCEQAVEVGRELRADYKMIARAFGRIGNSYLKLDDLENAIKYFNKSLTEHRTAEYLTKLRDAEKELARRAKLAYHSPELAEKERQLGNELFKKGDFSGAITHYTEAIKRDENDPRGYSNRAACYTKLMALPEAMKDCEKAIELDPTFVKAYIRKAAIQFMKKEYSKCLETCELAKQHDKDNKNSAEIDQQVFKCNVAMSQAYQNESQEETMKRAASDPEIARILGDPVMQSILQQMQQDPRAAQEHMKNPSVAANIRKLINAGIIRVA